MNLRKSFAAVAAAAVALALTGCIATPSQAASGVTITGAGSTFIQNYVEACAPGYHAATGNTVSYTGTGSGTGQSMFRSGTVDFAFSDSLMKVPANFAWEYIPMITGPVAVMFNLPGVKSVNMSQKTIAEVFAGKITKWNAPAIVADNKGKSVTTSIPVKSYKMVPVKKNGKLVKKHGKVVKVKKLVITYKTKTRSAAGVKLPNLPISVVYRSDGSGTSSLTTSFLAATSPSIWNKGGNQTFTAAFPGNMPSDGTFQGVSGSSLVASTIVSKPGAIGYAELSYAKDSKLGTVAVQNAAGRYVGPTTAGSSSFFSKVSVLGKGEIEPNYQTKDPGAYGIAGWTYGLVRTDGKLPNGNADSAKIKAIRGWMTYLTQTCVPLQAKKNYYAGLPNQPLTVAKTNIAHLG